MRRRYLVRVEETRVVEHEVEVEFHEGASPEVHDADWLFLCGFLEPRREEAPRVSVSDVRELG